MDIEEIIEKIVENGKVEDMETLSDILEDTMEIVKRYDKECYNEYLMELYKMAYGNTFTRQMAEEIVSKMKPYKMRWSYNEAQKIQDEFGINDISNTSFFIVLNSAYNDYRNIFGEDIENYVKFTVDFIKDEDAKEGKVFRYFTTIPE